MTTTIRRCLPTVLLLPFLAAASPTAAPTPVHGDYVEVRTASVFAGACHYNGERVTEGRSAILAWRIDGGAFAGVDLANVRVVAAVSCENNLAERGAARRSVIVVDAPSDAQAASAIAWVKDRCGPELGSAVDVRRAAVTFRHDADAFTVRVDRVATMAVHAMPDRACCSQPELVWYRPLMPLVDRRVGYTESATLAASSAGPSWQRSDENSAIYGTFDR